MTTARSPSSPIFGVVVPYIDNEADLEYGNDLRIVDEEEKASTLKNVVSADLEMESQW